MNFFVDFQILAAVNIWQGIKDFFANSIEWLFQLTNSLGVPSYILAILIFTIIIKILLQPLMNKQMRSSRRMQMLAPEVAEIKKKYASNPQKQQQLTMALYKEHGASPTAGCLPMLFQMPILIALFETLRHFGVEGSIYPLYPEYFHFWFWDNLALAVKDAAYPMILPLVAGAATFLQQLVTTPNLQDRTQRIMLIAFPIMFFFFVRSFPVLMAFYWIFYSLIGAAIMYPILRRWNKKDRAEIEEKRLQRAAEEEEKRAKHAAAKAASRKDKSRKETKPAYSKEEEAEEDADENAEDESGDENDPEKSFHNWLRENGYSIQKKRMKLHPYSADLEIVELVFNKKGQEKSIDALRQEFKSTQNLPQTPASIGELFGLSNRKNKKANNMTEQKGAESETDQESAEPSSDTKKSDKETD